MVKSNQKRRVFALIEVELDGLTAEEFKQKLKWLLENGGEKIEGTNLLQAYVNVAKKERPAS